MRYWVNLSDGKSEPENRRSEDGSTSSEILKWIGTVEAVNESSFEALLWRSDNIDPGDNRHAIISFHVLALDALSKVECGASFSCITVIPPSPGEPMIQDVVFPDPPPFAKP